MNELTLTAKQLAQLRRDKTDSKNNIRRALSLRGAQQRDLAAATGLVESQVSEIANGKPIMLDTARRICRAFGCCIEDIFPPACRKRAA